MPLMPLKIPWLVLILARRTRRNKEIPGITPRADGGETAIAAWHPCGRHLARRARNNGLAGFVIPVVSAPLKASCFSGNSTSTSLRHFGGSESTPLDFYNNLLRALPISEIARGLHVECIAHRLDLQGPGLDLHQFEAAAYKVLAGRTGPCPMDELVTQHGARQQISDDRSCAST